VSVRVNAATAATVMIFNMFESLFMPAGGG